MELIIKDEVIAIFDDIINDSTMPFDVKGFCIGAKNDINRLKTVEKRLTGHWICDVKSSFIQYQPNVYRCSNCNKTTNYKTKFCPECGAKMDGG